MDQFDSPVQQQRTGMVVIVLVLLGVGGVGAGAWVVLSKKNGGSEAATLPQEFEPWCRLRSEWAKKANPLAGDIMLKSVRPQDSAEHDRLATERNTLCQSFAEKLRELKVTDPALQQVEVALVKEGKMRANVAVEIKNVLAKIEAPDTATMSKLKTQLEQYISKRIAEGKATADQEIAQALAPFGAQSCANLYRGPITDEGSSDNPYVSWDELEVMRTAGVKQVDSKIKELEPLEQFTNRVYHELVRRYRAPLTKCFADAKKTHASMSDKMGFRLRLDAVGKVLGFAVEWMDDRGGGGDEKFLDCIESKATKWRLPPPDLQGKKSQIVVPTLDFAAI